MKKILLATTVLVGTAGFAAAEVTLSGSARMGVISTEGGDVEFTSRARVVFNLAGETDGGLAFGASFRADNADEANDDGSAGSVFISGAFGKLSMGDVDGAANAAVGHISGVGLTGLGDYNESTFIANGDGGSDALYEYSTGDLGFYLSATNPRDGDVAMSAAVSYAMGDYSFALGYEDDGDDTDHIIVGANATFGAVTVKARYGEASGGVDGSQMGVSVDYSMDALTLTAFYNDDEELGGVEAYGLGAAYDLGGGASVVGGYVENKTSGEPSYDLGVSFSF
ncbi:MAG: porin [Pseudomonadota bacterium]